MTNEEITKYARLAGINGDLETEDGCGDCWYGNQYLPDGALKRFALLIEEACVQKTPPLISPQA